MTRRKNDPPSRTGREVDINPLVRVSESTPTLPLSTITNANPAWMRASLGNGQDLADSIRRVGLQVPILLTREFQVVDGARRIEVYQHFGLNEIPVLVHPTWDVVEDYFRYLKTLEPSLPNLKMPWEDLWHLSLGPLRVLHREKGRERQGSRAEQDDYVSHISTLLGFQGSDLRTIREAFGTLKKIKRDYPQHYDRCRNALQVAEDTNSNLYSALRLIRETNQGIDPDTIKLGRPRRSLDDPPRTKFTTPAPPMPPADASMVDNAVQAISALTSTLRAFQAIDPAVTVDRAEQYAQYLRTSINDLNRFRRLLEAVKPSGEGETHE